MVQSRLSMIFAIIIVVLFHAIGIYFVIHSSEEKLDSTTLKGNIGINLVFEMIERENSESEINHESIDLPKLVHVDAASSWKIHPSSKLVQISKTKVASKETKKDERLKDIPKKEKRKQEGKEQTATQNKIGQGQKGIGSGRSSEAGFGLGSGKKSVQKSIDNCYPLISVRRGEEGTAKLRVYLGTENNVTSVTLIKSTGFSRLDQCAIKAAKEAKYESKIVNGKPVESYYEFPLTFKLKGRK